MSRKQKLIDYLMKLEIARNQAFENGEWERVDFIGQCISDAQNKLEKIS